MTILCVENMSDYDIDSRTLAHVVKYESDKTIIVDCRCFTDFNVCHIKNAVNAFYSKIMRRRLFENKVEPEALTRILLGEEDNHCGTMMDVVLYAEEHEKPTGVGRLCQKRRMAQSLNAPESSNKILKMLKLQLDNTNKFGQISTLKCGFGAFRSEFPLLCETAEGGNGGMSRLPSSISQPCLSQQTAPPTQVLPFLWLGGQQDALDAEFLKKNRITYVLNISINCPQSDAITDSENFMRIPINDSYSEKLSPYFEDAYNFIETVRKNSQVVLIHCLAGISRSPTLAISYVMRYRSLGCEDAYKYVKEKRPSISPNFNFMGQLLEYESQLIQRDILGPEVSSKRSLKGEEAEEPIITCPAKVPKSTSLHCIFPRPTHFDMTAAFPNENGKRGMQTAGARALDTPDRPRALNLFKPIQHMGVVTAPEELPSPSTDFSKLSVEHEDKSFSCANPFFDSPAPTPSKEVTDRPKEISQDSIEKNSHTNMVFARQEEIKRKGGMLDKLKHKFNWKKLEAVPMCAAARPDCLQSSGVPRQTASTVLPTTEEEEADSPESGFNGDSFKPSPESDVDRHSITSTSSQEIAVQ